MNDERLLDFLEETVGTTGMNYRDFSDRVNLLCERYRRLLAEYQALTERLSSDGNGMPNDPGESTAGCSNPAPGEGKVLTAAPNDGKPEECPVPDREERATANRGELVKSEGGRKKDEGGSGEIAKYTGVYCTVGELIDSETTLGVLGRQMEDEFRKFGAEWDREWMVNHVNARAALLTARKVLMDRVQVLTKVRLSADGMPVSDGKEDVGHG